MKQELSVLLEQSNYLRAGMEQLQKGIQSAYDESHQYDTESIKSCVAKIQKCVRLAGNNRVAALSARDMRKVMGELEEAVDQLSGIVNQ